MYITKFGYTVDKVETEIDYSLITTENNVLKTS